MGDAEVVPSNEDLPHWGDVLINEEPFDGHSTWEWAFKQCGFIDPNAKINVDKREMCIDLSKKDHVYNQQGDWDASRRDMKMWQVLLDSQSTCDVIVNRVLVENIRRCRWTLRLQTQAGECRIDHVADMPGVGTVWFYEDGIANILSQHRMATLSKWDIE